jgi:hypothetical protein
MRLYHSPPLRTLLCGWLGIAVLWLSAGCAAPEATQALININISADGQEKSYQLPAGSTVQQALNAADLSLNELDRVDPPVYTVLSEGANVRLVRVREEFEVEQQVLPFTQQTVRNESLAKEEEILIQPGKNGLQEITYRIVFEDGVQVSRNALPASVIVEQPLPEIRMIGIQTPFAPVAIPGILYYLRDGNLWAIEGTTGNRWALVTTGDLDGRVLSLSSDGTWLLFTRRSDEAGQINSLWAKQIAVALVPEATQQIEAQTETLEMIDLGVSNVIHFADFVPGSNTKIVFSTVEPRDAAPGWQANNDLNALTFSNTGWTTDWTVIMETNSGGVYGWWGTEFIWGPETDLLTFAQPGSIGTLNIKDGQKQTMFDILPLQTRGDWAWVPGIAWGPDGAILYAAHHVAPENAPLPEESVNFDLIAVPWQAGGAIPLATQVGMFSYPIVALPEQQDAGAAEGQIAYLQALFPNQSETSRYQLTIMDRDGSNRRVIFPPEESAGLDPQRYWGAWSPAPMPETGTPAIALIYQGNIWLVDTASGESIQVTGDGLTSRVIWR